MSAHPIAEEAAGQRKPDEGPASPGAQVTGRRVSVAIVGLGRAGWDLHLQPVREIPGFEITAVTDPLAERRREAVEMTGCAEFPDLEALLAESDAELVIIATPSLNHVADTLKVLEAGRHCIVEKPVAFAYSDAEKIFDLARQKERKVFVNHSYLHFGEIHHLLKAIRSGKLGKIFSIQTSWSSYSRRWDWQTLRKNGGGLLSNVGPHLLSMLLPMIGAPATAVYAEMKTIKDAGDAEDYLFAVLQAGNGITAKLTASTAGALSDPRWLIWGTTGALVSDGTSVKLRYYDAAKAQPLRVVDGAAPARQYSQETLPWEEEEWNITEDGVISFHQNVWDVLTHEADQIVTPESVLDVVRIMDQIENTAVKS